MSRNIIIEKIRRMQFGIFENTKRICTCNLLNKNLYHISVISKNSFFTGLTILLPYIISTRSNWEHCKMRIFALANHKQGIVAQEKE